MHLMKGLLLKYILLNYDVLVKVGSLSLTAATSCVVPGAGSTVTSVVGE